MPQYTLWQMQCYIYPDQQQRQQYTCIHTTLPQNHLQDEKLQVYAEKKLHKV